MQGKNSRSAKDALRNLPQIEDGGLDDRTVASPALGFGMERSDASQQPDLMGTVGSSEFPAATAGPGSKQVTQPPLPARPQPQSHSVPRLSRDEVAAISVDDRSYYVSDVPSPYLSSRMAREDIRKTRRRHARTTAIVMVVAIILVVGVSSWFLWQSMHREEAVALPEYATVSIDYGEFLETVEATSLLRPADERDVTAGISGKITEMLIQEGSPVNEGDEICHLDNPTITDSYNKARQAYDTAVSNVDARARALDEANRAASQAQSAAAAQTTQTTTTPGATGQTTSAQTTAAQTSVANAQARVQAAQNDYNRATESLKSIESTLQLAQEQQELLTLHAPISGTVGNMNAQATVDAAVTGSTHLCTITDASHLSLQVEIPEDIRPRVAVGQEVRITFPSIEGLAVTTTIDSFEDEETKEVANVLIMEPDPRLQKGMTAAASVIVQSVPDSYIVPLEAIQHDKNNAPYLEVLLDSSRDIKANIPVQVVATNKTNAAVAASNIQEGNTVIIPKATQAPATDSAQNAQPSAATNDAANPAAQPQAVDPNAQPQGEQPQAADPNAQTQGDQPAPEGSAAAA